MDERALVVLMVKPGTPFCVEQDAAPEFRLAVFDFTGNDSIPDLRHAAAWVLSARVEGKGSVLQALAQHPKFTDFDYCAVIDHDVLLSIGGINRLLFLGRIHGLDLFQPCLSHDSFISFPHLAQQPGRVLRETNFVECMAPFFSRSAFDQVKGTFAESISGYGLDFIWSSRIASAGGKVAVIDAVLAKHIHPLTPPNRVLKAGETPLEELQRILAHHGLLDFQPR